MNILITGAGSTMGQSIYKALAYSSLYKDMKIFFTNSDDKGAGLYFNNVIPIIVPLAASDNYIEFIDKIVKENVIDIIYSGTQHEIFRLAEYKKQNKNIAILNLNWLELSLDKYKCFQFLKENNINIPETSIIKEKILNFPFVIKPKTNSASRNIFIIKDLNDLKNFYTKKEDINNYILQEYIEGDEYTCGCYIDKISKKISTIIFKRILTKDGATGYGEFINSDIIKKYIISIANTYVKNGLDFGHLNIQLRMKDNQPFVFEINSRLSSTEASKAWFGFNSVEAYLYNIVLNQEYIFNTNTKKETKFLRYYEEVYF